MRNILTLLLVFVGALNLHSQIFTSNSAQLVITTGAVVYVNGGIDVSGSSSLLNNGTLTTTLNSSLPNPGDFRISSGSQVAGNGMYFVEQDWTNSGVFNAGSSTVTLFGNSQQYIGGTVITEFNNLTLTGSGTGINRKKTLQGVDSKTGLTGVLNINNRELETQTQSFYVLNPAIGAVSYDNTFGAEGFVSSLGGGYLYRNTNAAANYVFPTGSSVGTLRFRPVDLVPQSNVASQYAVRFNNVDPSSQNFDRTENDGTMCSLNPIFYHSIERISGTAPTDITINYIMATDGTWTGLAHWRNTSSNWNEMTAATAGSNGGFATQTKAAWSFSNSGHPYVLTKLKPGPPVLNCNAVCENSIGNSFSVVGSGTNYQWTVPSNASISSGQGSNNLLVDWTTGSGAISVVEIDASGCVSQPATCIPTVNQAPSVSFNYSSDGLNFSFMDQTTGATAWSWNFGDGGTASIINPTHTYLSGTNFNVTLSVTDNNGCTGSITQFVEMFEEMIIPNIITPNNDGTNDEFSFNTSGLTSYDIVIANRWGNVVYQSNDPSKFWDGKSNGDLVSEGVYFYTIKAKTATKEYKYSGNVTVIRQ